MTKGGEVGSFPPDHDDRVRRAYARLAAIRKNLAFSGDISESIVNEYHGALDHLASAGYDVEEFRVPASSIEREVIGVSGRRGGGIEYGDGKVVKGSLFLVKLDAILGYFEGTYRALE